MENMGDSRFYELKRYLEEARSRTEFIHAPEDATVKELCELYGYGAVMDSAMRQWLKKYGGSAFIIGACYDTVAALVNEPRWNKHE